MIVNGLLTGFAPVKLVPKQIIREKVLFQNSVQSPWDTKKAQVPSQNTPAFSHETWFN